MRIKDAQNTHSHLSPESLRQCSAATVRAHEPAALVSAPPREPPLRRTGDAAYDPVPADRSRRDRAHRRRRSRVAVPRVHALSRESDQVLHVGADQPGDARSGTAARGASLEADG